MGRRSLLLMTLLLSPAGFDPLAVLVADPGGDIMALDLRSSAFDAGGTIPRKHTCDGADVSPALSWSRVPEGTRTLALVMDDPDAPVGTWVHWVLYDLPADAAELPEGVPAEGQLQNGARQGKNDFGRLGHGGPCPPRGRPHRYSFRLYALDAATELPPGATKAELERAMQGHILAQAELLGRYGR